MPKVDASTEMAKLHHKFDLFDADGDGRLTKEEIHNVLTKGNTNKLNMQMADDFILKFNFNEIDSDGNGSIDIEEFILAFLPLIAKRVFDKHEPQVDGSPAAVAPRLLSSGGDPTIVSWPLPTENGRARVSRRRQNGKVPKDQLGQMLHEFEWKEGAGLDKITDAIKLGDMMSFAEFLHVCSPPPLQSAAGGGGHRIQVDTSLRGAPLECPRAHAYYARAERSRQGCDAPEVWRELVSRGAQICKKMHAEIGRPDKKPAKTKEPKEGEGSKEGA